MAESPDYRHWIEKAEQDVRAAQLMNDSGQSDFSTIIVFHCQQAAEKYLKACLRKQQIDFPKVHDFEQLLRLCERVSHDFRTLGPPAARLQPFAVQARYTLRQAEPATIEQGLRDMMEIRAFCRARMGLTDE